MKIAITVGHSILKSGLCTSANGVVNEYQYCKILADFLAKILRSAGCTVDIIICPEKQFAKSTAERTYKLPKINGKKYDLCIELHLNSYHGSAKGTEVLYCSNTGLSDKGNNETKPQTYDNAIIYSGDKDKAAAIIMKEFLPNSTIVDIADYKGHTKENVYTVGGGASNYIDKFGGHVTKFVGNDFKETYRKVVEWLEKSKLM